MSKVIKQKVTFTCKPSEVYNALMDSKKHTKFTGSPATIGKKVGDSFSAYGDYNQGVNVELVPNKRIVQLWQASDWEPQEWSVVIFDLKAKGKGCELTFTHVNVPSDYVADIHQGWKDYYWEPMKQMLEKK